ncbi:MAG: disulfide bond formation protein DsbD, partial [Micavibrio sp.]|nr:disulfide bond formation protein DsbD [Micavibrio sp.]
MKFFTALLFSTLILFNFGAAQATTGSNEPDKYVQVELIADKTVVQSGDTITIGIKQDIYPQWHTYWQNAGDSGTPLEIEWNAPEGFKFGTTQHPIPKIIDYGPLTNYGHEGETTLLQTLTLPENIPEGPIELSADINLLVCDDICIPENHKGTLILNGDQKPNKEAINKAQMALPTLLSLEGSVNEKEGDLIVNVITEDTNAFADIKSINLLPIEWGIIDNTATTKAEITSTGLKLTHKRGDRALSEISNFPFVIAYNDLVGNRQGIELSLSTQKVSNNSIEINFIQALLLAIAGGLILNLMPCVFPVLSMKALSLINLKGKEEAKAKAYGLSYTAGILVSFGLIAGALIALKAGGAQIGWGFQLQSPVVIIALSYLIFIIGLNLASFFEFSGRFSHWGQKLTTKSGHGGAFWTGVLATLVATPCTAPFMGAAIGFALTQNAFLSMLVFLGLGFGLALPYLLLCYIPALRRKLPHPGAWMETFRQFLSFPMFITTAWLLWVLTQQAENITVFLTLLGMIAITFGLWLMKRNPMRPLTKILHKIFLVIATIGFIAPIFTAQPITENGNIIATESENWENYSPEKLSVLLEGNDPVFVNMTASWCITCKVNEKTSLSSKKTKQLFADKNVQYLKGDWTNRNAEITQYLEKFNRNGVPLYVYYPAPETKGGKRPEPISLP